MLAVPLLLGVAASRASGWQLVLGGAAGAGYLASATAQAWTRARSRHRYSASLVVYVVIASVLGAALVVTHPALLLALLVLAPTGAVTLMAAAQGRARVLAVGLAQAGEALVLLPAAASLAGPLEMTAVAKATLLAAIYLISTVLAVRSVIREQGNAGFAAVSVGFNIAATAVGAAVLPLPFVGLLGVLTIRALLLPSVQRLRRDTSKPLRPIHVGIVEMILAMVLVGLAFVSPLQAG